MSGEREGGVSEGGGGGEGVGVVGKWEVEWAMTTYKKITLINNQLITNL